MDAQNVFALRGGKLDVEEGRDFSPKFDLDGLIPAMALDAVTKEPSDRNTYRKCENERKESKLHHHYYYVTNCTIRNVVRVSWCENLLPKN